MIITGILQKINLQKESGWGIFSVEPTRAVPGLGSPLKATGVLPCPILGTTYRFDGRVEHHPEFGDQFKFFSAAPVSDDELDDEGIIALLSSEQFDGIGPSRAKRIVAMFGTDTIRIIKKDPQRLCEVPGISQKLAASIHDQMPEDIGVWQELRMLLPGVTDNTISKIYNKYKLQSVVKVKADPYALIEDFDGIGFLRADAIAKNMGVANDDPRRVQAAIYYCLDNAASMEGHCFSYADNLQVLIQKLIPEVTVPVIASAIRVLTQKKEGRMALTVDKDGAIYLRSLFVAEAGCARVIRQKIAMKPRNAFTRDMIQTAANAVKARTGIELEASQFNAVYAALNHPLCVITGGPGTGKTTILNVILETIQTYFPNDYKDIALGAPTGRAARRIREATGFEGAKTIHAMLHLGGKVEDEFNGNFNASYLILDESSMIDIRLAYETLRSVKPGTHIIYIGDVDQLPPVGPGAFFRDLLLCYKVPTVKLTFSFRQKGSIAVNANKLNHGEGIHAFVQDNAFHFVKADKETGPQTAVNEYLKLVRKYGKKEAILLTPTRKRGEGSANELNTVIQEILNPRDESTENSWFESHFTEFRIGDRIMLTKNNVVEGHANGDTGELLRIDETEVLVQFDTDAFPIVVKKDVFTNFVLSYACTVHKSQGSEYCGVVVLFTTEHAFMGERNLLYTGITRAKQEVSLVGDARAISKAIGTVKQVVRNSKLKERILA